MAIVAYADIPLPDKAEAKLLGPMKGIRVPGRVEVSRWAELLDWQAGLRRPKLLQLPRPEDLTEDEQIGVGALELMLSVRDDRWHGQGFTLARRHFRARTKFTNGQARAVTESLRRRMFLKPEADPERGRLDPIVYQLGSLLEILGSEDALVEAFRVAFDAVEITTTNETTGATRDRAELHLLRHPEPISRRAGQRRR